MSLQTEIDEIAKAIHHNSIGLGDKINVSLAYQWKDGYIEPMGSYSKPAWLPDNAIRAVFQEMLNRQQQKELPTFRNLWENKGVEFDFNSNNHLATLTLIKEKHLDTEVKPAEMKEKKTKAGKAPKAKKAAKVKAPKKAKASKGGGRGRKGYGAEQKAEVLEFIKSNPGRGILKKAASKFKISYPTVNNWVKGAGISAKAPKAGKAPKGLKVSGKGAKGVLVLNGVKYAPVSSIVAPKPAKAAKANKGLARAVKALEKALGLLKKSA